MHLATSLIIPRCTGRRIRRNLDHLQRLVLWFCGSKQYMNFYPYPNIKLYVSVDFFYPDLRDFFLRFCSYCMIILAHSRLPRIFEIMRRGVEPSIWTTVQYQVYTPALYQIRVPGTPTIYWYYTKYKVLQALQCRGKDVVKLFAYLRKNTIYLNVKIHWCIRGRSHSFYMIRQMNYR
jgi:hypothetical protein